MRSGYVNVNKETGRQVFRGASFYGYGWSASLSTTSTTQAYDLYFTVGDTYPSRGPYDRRFAFPLRCLSTTAVGTLFARKRTLGLTVDIDGCARVSVWRVVDDEGLEGASVGFEPK